MNGRHRFYIKVNPRGHDKSEHEAQKKTGDECNVLELIGSTREIVIEVAIREIFSIVIRKTRTHRFSIILIVGKNTRV